MPAPLTGQQSGERLVQLLAAPALPPTEQDRVGQNAAIHFANERGLGQVEISGRCSLPLFAAASFPASRENAGQSHDRMVPRRPERRDQPHRQPWLLPPRPSRSVPGAEASSPQHAAQAAMAVATAQSPARRRAALRSKIEPRCPAIAGPLRPDYGQAETCPPESCDRSSMSTDRCADAPPSCGESDFEGCLAFERLSETHGKRPVPEGDANDASHRQTRGAKPSFQAHLRYAEPKGTHSARPRRHLELADIITE